MWVGQLSGSRRQRDVAKDLPVSVTFPLPHCTEPPPTDSAVEKMCLRVTGLISEVVIDVRCLAAYKAAGCTSEPGNYLFVLRSHCRRSFDAVASSVAVDGVLRVAGNDTVCISRLETIDPCLVTGIDVLLEVRGPAATHAQAENNSALVKRI